MSGFYIMGASRGIFLCDSQTGMTPLAADRFHAVFTAGKILLHDRFFLKGLGDSLLNSRLKLIPGEHLCNSPAAGTVGGFHDHRETLRIHNILL